MVSHQADSNQAAREPTMHKSMGLPASLQLKRKNQRSFQKDRNPIFDYVPNEIIHEISVFVDLKSLLAFSGTNRRIGGVINNNKFRHPCRKTIPKVHFDLVNNVVTKNNATPRCEESPSMLSSQSFPLNYGPKEGRTFKPYCFGGMILPTMPDINRQISLPTLALPHSDPNVRYYLRQEGIRNTKVRPKSENAMALLDIFESAWHYIPTNITLDPYYEEEHQIILDNLPKEWKTSVTGIEYRKGTKHMNLHAAVSALKSLENIRIEEGCCFTKDDHYTKIVNNMTNLKSIVDNRDRGWTQQRFVPILSDDTTLEALINRSKTSPLHQFWIHASSPTYSFKMIKRFLLETNFASTDEVFLFHFPCVRGASMRMIDAWLQNNTDPCNLDDFNESQNAMVDDYSKCFKFQYNNRPFAFFFSQFPDSELKTNPKKHKVPMLFTPSLFKEIDTTRKQRDSIMRNS